MSKGPFLLQHMLWMKKGLILIAIILVSAPITSANDGDWIDGITFRLAGASGAIKIYFSEGGEIIGTNEPGDVRLDHLEEPEFNMFPIVIELKENLINSWSYRSAFLDWTFNRELNDLPPNEENAEFTTRSSTSQNLRQTSDTRTDLLNKFFNSSEKEFTDANSDWALSADVKYSLLMIGYYWGVFYPAYGGSHRWFKFGIGGGVFSAQIKVDYNLCSAYIVTGFYYANGVKKDIQSGECSGKKKIDTIEAETVGAAAIMNISLWERVTKDSIWRFAGGEVGETIASVDSKKEKFGLKGRSSYFVPSLSFITVTVVSYTSRF